MNSEPKSATLMAQSEYARHRGKSRQYISRLAKAGVLVMRGSQVDVAASDAVLDDRPVDVAPSPTPRTSAQPHVGDGGQQPTSFAQARAVDQVYKAKLRRLEFEAKERRLISAAEVEAAWSEAGIAIRDAVMGLAPRVCNRLPAEWRAELSVVLDDEARKALRLLSDDIRNRKIA